MSGIICKASYFHLWKVFVAKHLIPAVDFPLDIYALVSSCLNYSSTIYLKLYIAILACILCSQIFDKLISHMAYFTYAHIITVMWTLCFLTRPFGQYTKYYSSYTIPYIIWVLSVFLFWSSWTLFTPVQPPVPHVHSGSTSILQSLQLAPVLLGPVIDLKGIQGAWLSVLSFLFIL